MWFDIVYGPHNSRNVLIESLLFLVVSQQLENDIVTSVLSVIISLALNSPQHSQTKSSCRVCRVCKVCRDGDDWIFGFRPHVLCFTLMFPDRLRTSVSGVSASSSSVHVFPALRPELGRLCLRLALLVLFAFADWPPVYWTLSSGSKADCSF